MTNSNVASSPRKPREDFPLFPHASGRWAKKVKGRFCYFGKVADDPQGEAALDLWLAQRDYLLAGRKPPTIGTEPTLRDLLNRFMGSRDALEASGELSPRTRADYMATCERIATSFGKHRILTDIAPDDFAKLRTEITRTRGPVATGNEIQRVRTVFKYAYDNGMIEAPVRFGSDFAKPSRKTIRKVRQSKGARLFTPAEIQAILKETGLPLKAMVLLALNCGMGNSDCASLTLTALDLKAGWLDFPRVKTGVERRVPLWKETVAELRKWLDVRPDATDEGNAGLVFITKYGRRFSNEGKADCAISKEFRKVLDELELHKPGLSFYSLRHVFQTIADEARDPVATMAIMAHVDESMSAVYREKVSDERLRGVVEHVRKWLFAKPAKPKSVRKAKAKV